MGRPVDWVSIPAGTVLRGTPHEDVRGLVRDHADLAIPVSWFEKECPRAAVTVPGFLIARTPVTNDQYSAFLADRGERVPPDGVGDHPATGVPWHDAAAYCRWLSGRSGRSVRLPTEDEWERAARGDDAREFPWGDEYAADRANLAEAGIGGPAPVGALPLGASPFGVLDMVGSVDEWTATEFAPYPGAPATVPRTESWAADPHVTRGGAWFHHRDLARCARRHGAYDRELTGIGFRLAADLPDR